MNNTKESKAKHFDFDLYGIIGVRLINPTEADLKNSSKGLNHFKGNLDRDPDIELHFKKDIDISKIKLIGLNFTGFDDNDFYVLSNGREDLVVKIPLEDVGNKKVIIECKSGLPGIPLLGYIINFLFIKKGFLPLHGTSFNYNDETALVMGWAKGGKTESLLSFAKNGAEYIGDETLIMSPDGKKIYSMPIAICIWDWQRKYVKDILPPLSLQKKFLFGTIHFMDFSNNSLQKSFLKNIFPAKFLKDSLPTLKRQLNVMYSPEKLFNNSKNLSRAYSVNKLILALSHNKEEISVEECDTAEIVERMTASHEFEYSNFFGFYKAFKFAFPKRKNDFLENIMDDFHNKLISNIASFKSYKVFHPYPVDLDLLFDKMKPIFDKKKETKLV